MSKLSKGFDSPRHNEKEKKKKTNKGHVFKQCGLSGVLTRLKTSQVSWINTELVVFDIIWTSRDLRSAATRHKMAKIQYHMASIHHPSPLLIHRHLKGATWGQIFALRKNLVTQISWWPSVYIPTHKERVAWTRCVHPLIQMNFLTRA